MNKLCMTLHNHQTLSFFIAHQHMCTTRVSIEIKWNSSLAFYFKLKCHQATIIIKNIKDIIFFCQGEAMDLIIQNNNHKMFLLIIIKYVNVDCYACWWWCHKSNIHNNFHNKKYIIEQIWNNMIYYIHVSKHTKNILKNKLLTFWYILWLATIKFQKLKTISIKRSK